MLNLACRACATHDPERMLINDGSFSIWPKRIGNSILLCGKKDTQFPQQLFVGPDWFCMIITYCLITIPTILFIINIAGPHWNLAFTVVAIFLLISTVCTFSVAACSDPGIVFHDQSEEETVSQEMIEAGTTLADQTSRSVDVTRTRPGYVECGICQHSRPVSASHCYDCGVCVDKLDHHCPWTGKCIGKKNLSPFYSFLWSLTFLIIFVAVMVIVTVVRGLKLT